MISETNLSLFDIDEADTYVVTTNCVGPMGAGLARVARDKIPGLELCYRRACREGKIQPGKLFFYQRFVGKTPERIAICFPTKRHWKDPSRLDDIEAGLLTLVDIAPRIGRIVIPPLGCGLGGLDWTKEVAPLVYHHLNKIDNQVVVAKGGRDTSDHWGDVGITVGWGVSG